MSSVADGPHAPRGNDQRAMRVAPRKTTKHLGARVPVRRPSGGVAEGDEPHGCGERRKGAGTPLVRRPPEWHRKEGSLAAGQTRMSGCPSLWLLSLGQTRESDSPCRAKSVGGAEERVAVKSPCLRHKIRGLSPNVSRRAAIRKQRKVRRRKGAKHDFRYA